MTTPTPEECDALIREHWNPEWPGFIPDGYKVAAFRSMLCAVLTADRASRVPRERAIWLRRDGDHFVVAIEVGKQWVDLIREYYDSPSSHIIEPAGIQECIDAATGAKE